MSEDRELMMEHRLLTVLREQAPEGLVAVRLSAAAKVSIDNTERLLRAAEREGIVTSFVNDDGRDVWKIALDPVLLKDIDGSKPVEQLLVEEFAEGDLRELLHELDPFDLPDGWTLLPPWTETAAFDGVLQYVRDGKGDWQVCTSKSEHLQVVYLLTDIPHPDDPRAECVFELDVDQSFRLLILHLEDRLRDGRREASE